MAEFRMSHLSGACLKIVRWSGWLLLPLLLGFFFTGYASSGRFGLGVLLSAQMAVTLHKLLHAPLIVLSLAHVVPAMYLAFQRWSGIRS
jgi:hypothetical protein